MIYSYDKYKPTFDCGFIKSKSNNTGDTYILNDFISLDTETSWNHNEENPLAWIYQWCFAIGNDIVIGRKPTQLIQALNIIIKEYGLDEKHKIIIYVHNLSYDIQYLKNYLIEEYGQSKILAIAKHKFISFEVGSLIFKCSYKLSNKSLAKWAKDLQTKHRKLEGAIDYNIIRTQQTKLKRIDWKYQILDVLTLRDCINKQLEIYNDTLASIPLTSTGYIRREARKNYKKNSNNRNKFLKSSLNETTYSLARKAFAGGFTHGNRFFSEQTVKGNIKHRDFVSHYPSQQRTKMFPSDKFCLYKKEAKIKDILKIIDTHCCLFEIELVNPKLKNKKTTVPYISEFKARQGAKTKCKYISDNGRLLSCKGCFSLVVTEIDFKWIMKQYEFEAYRIPCVYTSVKSKLPLYMIETVDEFFYGKSNIKDLLNNEKKKKDKDINKILDLEIDLMKSKNGLNGIYGMSATDIVRTTFDMDSDTGEWEKKQPSTNEEIKEALEKYYKSKNNFMQYQFGVWTTAYARDELLTAIEIIENNGGTFLYADTDSAFYVSNFATENALEEWNAKLLEESERQNAYIIKENGQKVYYRQFADEQEKITEFRFLHAKCYGYMCDNELKITIAGVSPFEDSRHKYTREKELGKLDNLKQGTIFTRCGGTKAKYIELKPCVLNNQECSSACIITKTTKTLNNEITLGDELIDWEVI